MYGQLCVYRQADRRTDRQTEWFQYSPKLCLQAYKQCDMVKKKTQSIINIQIESQTRRNRKEFSNDTQLIIPTTV